MNYFLFPSILLLLASFTTPITSTPNSTNELPQQALSGDVMKYEDERILNVFDADVNKQYEEKGVFLHIITPQPVQLTPEGGGEGEDERIRRLATLGLPGSYSGSYDSYTDLMSLGGSYSGSYESYTDLMMSMSMSTSGVYLDTTPSAAPSVSFSPSAAPTVSFAPSVSHAPSSLPSSTPSSLPSSTPSSSPSVSHAPSSSPSSTPSGAPSLLPSATASLAPSGAPSLLPSSLPSTLPSTAPSSTPSALPSAKPSSSPTSAPTLTFGIKLDLIGEHKLQALDDGSSISFADDVGVFETALDTTISSTFDADSALDVLVDFQRALDYDLQLPFNTSYEDFVRGRVGYVDSEFVRFSLQITVVDGSVANPDPPDLTVIALSVSGFLTSSGFETAFIAELVRRRFSLVVTNANITSVSPPSSGAPAPAFEFVETQEAFANSAEVEISGFSRSGTLYCSLDEVGEFYEPFSDGSPALPLPSFAKIKDTGLSAGIRGSWTTVKFEFNDLNHASLYVISCFTEAVNSVVSIGPSIGLGFGGPLVDPVETTVVSSMSQNVVVTALALALPSDDTCSREINRTSIELNTLLLANGGAVIGTTYVFAQKSTLPPPSTATVMANGRAAFFDGSAVVNFEMADPDYEFTVDVDVLLQQSRICLQSQYVADNTIAVVLDGLQPLTEYSVYMFTESTDNSMSDGFMHWLFDAAPRVIKTSCCGFVSLGADFSDSVLFTNQGVSNLINFQSVFISQPPTASVRVTIAISLYAKSDGVACTTSPGSSVTALSPRTADFTSADVSALALLMPFDIQFPSAGCVIYDISFSGTSEDEYDSESKRVTLEVFSPDDIPPPPAPPSVLSARFGNTGTFLEITFSSDTDRGIKGGITTPNGFRCNLMFSVTTATSRATCKFTTASTLQMTLTSAATAVIGDTVRLLASTIYASCDDDVFDCDSAEASPVQDVFILAPTTPLVPIPLITGPSSIASCSNIVLSGSTSSGSGGRGWTASSLAVVASAPSDKDVALQAFISARNAAGFLSNTFTVSNALLTPGISYTFQLTLRNFLGFEGTSRRLVVLVATQSIPSISIDGSAFRSVDRAAPLSLFANGIASVCPGEPATLIPIANYVWSVTSAAFSPVSTSIDNRFFRLNSFVLVPGRTYTFTVTVTDSAAIPLSNSASVRVSVNEAAVIASISGGNRGVSKTETTAVLSASNTYDPDYPILRGTAGGFVFEWTCLELSPRRGPCNQFSALNATVESLAFTPSILESFLNTMLEVRMRFTVQATHSATGRLSTAMTAIKIQDNSPPIVTIQPLLAVKVNPSRKLNLVGRVTQSAGSPVSATWTCDELGISLAAVALSQIAKIIPTGLSTVDFGLIIGENALEGDVLYTFRLSAIYAESTDSNQGTGFAEITVRVNSPPVNGIVLIENEEGVNNGTSLLTKFTISSLDWVDDLSDLPLTYTFSYVKGLVEEGYVSGRREQIIQFESLSTSKADVFLPQGEGSEGLVTIIVRVGDSFGAKSVATTVASVKAPNLNLVEVGELTKELTTELLARGDSSSVFQVLASSVGFLNSVNCSSLAAGFCESLTREDCSLSEESQTCGVCLEGYIPSDPKDAGAANTQCLIKQDSCSDGIQNGAETDVDCGGGCGFCAVGRKCDGDEDCVFGECTNSVCTAPTKLCRNDCNGRGRCQAFNYNSVSMGSVECKVNMACDVVCVCDLGFFGEACGKGAEEQLEAETLRQFMLESIFAVGALQFVSADTLNQQSGAVFNILRARDELNRESLDLAASLLTTIARDSIGLPDFSVGTAVFLGEGLSQLMVVTNETTSSDFGNFSTAIDNLGQAQLDILFVDEETLELITANLKMASVKASFLLMSDRSFSSPLNDDDIASGRSSPIMKMPPSGLSTYYDESCDVGLSVTELGSHRRKDSSTVDTTVMRIGVGCYKPVEGADATVVSRRMSYSGNIGKRRGRALAEDEDSSSTKVLIVLQNTDTDADANADVEGTPGTVIPVMCNWDEFRNITTTCPDGVNVVTECNGIEKKVSITCGGTFLTNTCAFSSPSTEWNAESCVVVDSNAMNITCECDMSVIFAGDSSNRRRLEDIDGIDEESSDENNVDFAGLFLGVSRNVQANFELTTTLSPAVVAANGFVFVAMGLVLLLSFGFFMRGMKKDAEEKQRIKISRQLESVKFKLLTIKESLNLLKTDSTPLFVKHIDNLWVNIKAQFRQRHLAANAVYYHSFVRSRPQRVALLTCTVLGMFFGESVIFDLAYPDFAPKCETNLSKLLCEEPKSYYGDANNCLWTSESQSCSFIEPTITLYGTFIISIIGCIFTSPLFVILLVFFNSSVFPATKGSDRAIADKIERKEKAAARALAQFPWEVYGKEDEENISSTPDAQENSGGEVEVGRGESSEGSVGENGPGGAGRTSQQARRSAPGSFNVERTLKLNLSAKESLQRSEDESKSVAAAEKTLRGRSWTARLSVLWGGVSDFRTRVDEEVRMVMSSVVSREMEYKSTIDLLQQRFDDGDAHCLTQLQNTMARLNRFQKDWRLEGGRHFFSNVFSRDFEYLVREKVHDDFKLADGIMKEFATLDHQMKEVRLLEYGRMMKLSRVERRIYFRNRLIINEHLTPVAKVTKVLALTLVAAYCFIIAYYICLFGVSHGSSTTNAWLFSVSVSGALDLFIFMPLKIVFLNIFLPSLISTRLTSIDDPGDAESIKFSSFMPQNAAVHVALKHPELDSSILILAHQNKNAAGRDDAGDGEYVDERETEDREASENARRAEVVDQARRKYTTNGCSRASLAFFTYFIMLPSILQDSLLDVMVPSLIGLFVVGNYELYNLEVWGMFAALAAVLCMIFGILFLLFFGKDDDDEEMDEETEEGNELARSGVAELALLLLKQNPAGAKMMAAGARARGEEKEKFDIDNSNTETVIGVYTNTGGGGGGLGLSVGSVGVDVAEKIGYETGDNSPYV